MELGTFGVELATFGVELETFRAVEVLSGGRFQRSAVTERSGARSAERSGVTALR